jgi:predicted enzyme related to lactoylglutathione lyase
MADVTGLPVWYELLTTDMKAAGVFYAKVVGWTTKSVEHAPQPYDFFERSGAVGVGGVMDIPQGMSFPPHWEMYIAVQKIEDAVATIEKLGGKALSPLIDIPNVGRMRTVMDPQGGVFAIFEAAPTDQPRPAAKPEIGDASWHELYTTDSAAAMTFYTALFGWTPTTAMDMGPMGTYRMFGRGEFELGGMMTKPKEMADMPTAWNIYFRVTDVDAAAALIKANGGRVTNGPMDVPGGDRVVNGMDPQGAHFSLHQKKD